jgi:nucleolin
LYFNNCSNYSAQSGGTGQSQTIFVRGFDKSLGEDEVILSPPSFSSGTKQLCCVHSSLVLLIVLLRLHFYFVIYFQLRSKLEQHFGSCGEVTRVSIPKDFDSGYVKGYISLLNSIGILLVVIILY